MQLLRGILKNIILLILPIAISKQIKMGVFFAIINRDDFSRPKSNIKAKKNVLTTHYHMTDLILHQPL